MQPVGPGSRGAVVAEVRRKLAVLGLLAEPAEPGDALAAEYDTTTERAVRWFQQERGLRVDGVVGADTYRALEEARWRLGDRVLGYAASRLQSGDDVADLQRRLLQLGFDPGRCDGSFGPRTEAALRQFQRNVGVADDGTCGPRTLAALHRLDRTVVGGSFERMREEERLRQASLTPAGTYVVVDAGHGGEDVGARGHGLREADVAADLAARLEGRLGTMGITSFLTHGPDSNPSENERAAFANEAHVDLVISVHCDGSADPNCHGVATYYYGNVWRRTGSPVGARLAELIQEEVTTRTDLLDCRTHPKTWDLLRLTRMPTVRVEVGYLSNAGDAARLADADFRDAVVDGIAAAVQRLQSVPGPLGGGATVARASSNGER